MSSAVADSASVLEYDNPDLTNDQTAFIKTQADPSMSSIHRADEREAVKRLPVAIPDTAVDPVPATLEDALKTIVKLRQELSEVKNELRTTAKLIPLTEQERVDSVDKLSKLQSKNLQTIAEADSIVFSVEKLQAMKIGVPAAVNEFVNKLRSECYKEQDRLIVAASNLCARKALQPHQMREFVKLFNHRS